MNGKLMAALRSSGAKCAICVPDNRPCHSDFRFPGMLKASIVFRGSFLVIFQGFFSNCPGSADLFPCGGKISSKDSNGLKPNSMPSERRTPHCVRTSTWSTRLLMVPLRTCIRCVAGGHRGGMLLMKGVRDGPARKGGFFAKKADLNDIGQCLP